MSTSDSSSRAPLDRQASHLSGSEHGEQTLQQQQSPSRSHRACDLCYRKKIKCDGARPRCDYCHHHRVDCTFQRPFKTGKRKPQGRVASLGERMEKIERLLSQKLGSESLDRLLQNTHVKPPAKKHVARGSISGDSQASASAPTPTPKPPSRLVFTDHPVPSVDLYFGIPFLSRGGQKWISFESGLNTSGSLWQSSTPPKAASPQSPDALEPPSPAESSILPPKDTVLEMLNAYLASDFGSVFPFVTPDLFKGTIDRAYDGDINVAKACVLAFVCFAPWFTNEQYTDIPSVDPERSLQVARLMFQHVVRAQVSTEVVQALVMSAVWDFTTGNLAGVDIVLAIAIRLLYSLGTHLRPGTASTTPAALHHRDLFWICYSFDKEIAFRTGRPPVINDNACDLTFPSGYLGLIRSTDGPGRFPGDLRLTLIKSAAYEKLYTVSALQNTDAALLRDIRELDDMLERWRQSVPAEFRPHISYQPSMLPNIPNMRWAILWLEYYHCLATIHQASARCHIWNGPEAIHQGVSSSLDIASESSRSLLLFFCAFKDYALPIMFWVLMFYPLSSQLTLFCNIISNASSEAAMSDLQLLEELRILMRDWRKRPLSIPDAQAAHILHLDEFSDEIITLARSAILEKQIPDEHLPLLSTGRT